MNNTLPTINAVTTTYDTPTVLNLSQVMTDYCTQIDTFIGLCCLIILTIYVVRTKLLDVAVFGFEKYIPYNYLDDLKEGIESFFDTMILFSASFMYYIFVEQNGMTLLHKFWLGTLVVFVIIAFIVKKKRKSLEHKVRVEIK